MKTLLLVDDEDDPRNITKWHLENLGFVIECARSAEDALALFDPRIHDLVVTDNSMSGMTGAEMAHIIKIRSPSTPVIMFTGQPPEDRSCLDVVILRSSSILDLQDGINRLLAAR